MEERGEEYFIFNSKLSPFLHSDYIILICKKIKINTRSQAQADIILVQRIQDDDSLSIQQTP